MTVSNFSSLAGLEHTFLVGLGRVRSDDGYSNNRAISVQLGRDLTELGNILEIVSCPGSHTKQFIDADLTDKYDAINKQRTNLILSK